jgi:hypothetical protein
MTRLLAEPLPTVIAFHPPPLSTTPLRLFAPSMAQGDDPNTD